MKCILQMWSKTGKIDTDRELGYHISSIFDFDFQCMPEYTGTTAAHLYVAC